MKYLLTWCHAPVTPAAQGNAGGGMLLGLAPAALRLTEALRCHAPRAGENGELGEEQCETAHRRLKFLERKRVEACETGETAPAPEVDALGAS